MIALRTAATPGWRIVISFFCRLHVLVLHKNVSRPGHTRHRSTDLVRPVQLYIGRQKARSLLHRTSSLYSLGPRFPRLLALSVALLVKRATGHPVWPKLLVCLTRMRP